MIVTARGLLAASCALLLAACATPPGPEVRPTPVAAAVPPSRPASPAPRAEPPAVVPPSVRAPAADEARPPETGTPSPGAVDAAPPTRTAENTHHDGPETGLASWYGRKFHGRRTASGERYDMHAMTAAHRTLPFGTKVRVRSVATGKEVVVRINDRGPYRHQRLIDLSQAAIMALGLRSRGVTMVELAPE